MMLQLMNALNDGSLLGKFDAAINGVTATLKRYDERLTAIDAKLSEIERQLHELKSPREIITGENGILVTGAVVNSDGGADHHG